MCAHNQTAYTVYYSFTVSEKDFTDYGCIAIAVLTHGTHGGLLRAKDMQYSETEIIKHFKAVKNPTLITKPKILIIQVISMTFFLKFFKKCMAIVDKPKNSGVTRSSSFLR